VNYNVFMTDEALEDVFGLVNYTYTNLLNPSAGDKLYRDLKREIESTGYFPLKFYDTGFKYRGYEIHKKCYKSYLIFYIINDEKHEVYILRVLKEIMDWRKMLKRKRIYHFTNLSDRKGIVRATIPLTIYKYFFNSAINSSYSASVKNFCCGFIANTPPHSNSSVYFGTRWK